MKHRWQWVQGPLRFLLVSGGIIVLTSVTVDAVFVSSTPSQSALGLLVSRSLSRPSATCREGTTLMSIGSRKMCVDQFENSPSASCPHATIMSLHDSEKNHDTPSCGVVSEKNRHPWTYVSYHRASDLCARAGKRLPTSQEWYVLGMGTPDSIDTPVCHNQGNSVRPTGFDPGCQNGFGVADAVGNVWEWVSAEVRDGVYNTRELPESGYVSTIDTDGIALTTSTTSNTFMKQDYMWSDNNGSFGMLRGGFYGSGNDAGLYSVQAKTEKAFSSNAVGFRCVQDVI
jgi:hypothetical protein